MEKFREKQRSWGYYTTTDRYLQVMSRIQGDCMQLCIQTLSCPSWSLLRIPPRSDIHTSTCSTSSLFPLVIFFSFLLTSYLKGYLVLIPLPTLLASILRCNLDPENHFIQSYWYPLSLGCPHLILCKLGICWHKNKMPPHQITSWLVIQNNCLPPNNCSYSFL